MHNVVSLCGRACGENWKTMWTLSGFIHTTHNQLFQNKTVKKFYSTLNTTCAQLSHNFYTTITSVSGRFSAVSTAPITTTKYIKE